MGDTAAPPPPGASAAAAALDGAGVPLGATELFVGGLSPSPTDLGGGCPSAIALVVTLGTGAIFSGDGTLSMSPSDLGGATTASDTGCSIAPTAGVGPLGLSSTTGAAPAFGGGEHSARDDRASDHRTWRHDRSAREHYALQLHGGFGLCASPLQSPLPPGLAPTAGIPIGQVC